jgi:hypothetical protein
MKNISQVLAVLVLVTLTTAAIAQVNSNTASVAVSATLSEQLVVSVTGGPLAFGNVSPNTSNNASNEVSITTNWVLGNAKTTVDLYGYFDSLDAMTAASPNSDTIPTTALKAVLDHGVPTSFATATLPTGWSAAAPAVHFATRSLGSTYNNMNGAGATNSLNLVLDLTGLSVRSDTYNGILHLRAQAN